MNRRSERARVDPVQPDVHVHIERLVLDGLPLAPGEAARVRAALETELAGLLADGQLPPGLSSGGSFADLPAAEMSLPPAAAGGRAPGGAGPDGLGRGIARALFGRIGT